MTLPSDIVRKTATCPECEATVRYKVRKGVKRFQPKLKRCQACGAVFQ